MLQQRQQYLICALDSTASPRGRIACWNLTVCIFFSCTYTLLFSTVPFASRSLTRARRCSSHRVTESLERLACGWCLGRWEITTSYPSTLDGRNLAVPVLDTWCELLFPCFWIAAFSSLCGVAVGAFDTFREECLFWWKLTVCSANTYCLLPISWVPRSVAVATTKVIRWVPRLLSVPLQGREGPSVNPSCWVKLATRHAETKATPLQLGFFLSFD